MSGRPMSGAVVEGVDFERWAVVLCKPDAVARGLVNRILGMISDAGITVTDRRDLERERLRLLAATQLPKYDLLFATVLDESKDVDTEHDYDPRYRRLVDQHAHRLLAEDSIPHQRVTSDPDNQAHAIDVAIQRCLKEAAV
jgi:hypothetical protein